MGNRYRIVMVKCPYCKVTASGTYEKLFGDGWTMFGSSSVCPNCKDKLEENEKNEEKAE